MPHQQTATTIQGIGVASTMSSVQVAQLTNKNHSDLMKSIRKMEKVWVKLGEGKFSLGSYIDKNNQARPMYELSKKECLYIATKFNDEARAKLIIRWEELEKSKNLPSQYANDPIIGMRMDQLKMEQRITALEAKTVTRPEYYTIAGYGSLTGVRVNIKLASMLGRAATKLCKERNLMTDTCPDPRFGVVKMYPTEVLDEVFKSVAI